MTPAAAVDDTAPPAVESLSVSPASVDTSSGAQKVTVTAHITDDLSGISDPGTGGALAVFKSLPGTHSLSVGFYAAQRISGSPQDGIYRSTMTVPLFARQSTWAVTYLSMGDAAGNSSTLDTPAEVAAAGLDASFQQTGVGDGEAPTVDGVTVSPSTVDTSGSSKIITVTAHITDSPAGISGFYGGLTLSFVGPSGRQSNYAFLRGQQRISGSAQDGMYRAEMVVPRYAEQGTWRVSSAQLVDDIGGYVGNTKWISGQAELTASGLDQSFKQTGVGDGGDIQPPVVESLTISPPVVDTAAGPQTVTVTAHITDDLSGISEDRGLWLSFAGPSRSPNTWAWASLTASARISGTPRDGIYQFVMTAPQDSEVGTWTVIYAVLADAAGNSPGGPALTLAERAAAGVNVTFRVGTPAAPTAPSAVAGNPGDAQVALTWSAPADDGGSPVTSYSVSAYAGTTLVTTVPTTGTATTVAGLTNGTAYTFVVRATNALGTGAPSAPSAPVTPASAANPAPPVREPPPVRSGYWMVGSDGAVHGFGDAEPLDNAPVGSARAVDLEPTPSGHGYWVVDDLGHVFSFGDAEALGNVEPSRLTAGEMVTSLSATPAGDGYWIFTSRGRVLTFGEARFLGDMSAERLNGPVLDSIPTPSGHGYYMVASDGGIFAFGDARFAGSMGGQPLNAPVQSLVPDGNGVGYWLVASDGGVFAFDAPFRGSMGDEVLNKPVTGMVPFGNGYLMVGEDGGIFNFSDRSFYGSLGSNPPAHPITSVAALDGF